MSKTMTKQQADRFIRAVEFLGDPYNDKRWSYKNLVKLYFPEYYDEEKIYSADFLMIRFKDFLIKTLMKIQFED